MKVISMEERALKMFKRIDAHLESTARDYSATTKKDDAVRAKMLFEEVMGAATLNLTLF